MTGHPVDLAAWPRAAQFRWFLAYARPHYAITSRLDVTRLMTVRKAAGASPYRACLHAIGCGLHAVPELRMRFRGDAVTVYDRTDLSVTVPTGDGGFNYAYLPFDPDPAAFEESSAARIASAAVPGRLDANDGMRLDVAYLSCLPWLDYTALDNALPGPEDCIPRVSWGKFVEAGGRWSCAMTLQVHHALVDGLHVGAVFAAVQGALDA